jgi:phosphohistidine swiveling domain-containing protein
MNIDAVKQLSWSKNWVLKCGLGFPSLYGELYTAEFSKHLGKNFENSLYLFENGMSMQYLIDAELKRVLKSFSDEIKAHPENGKDYAQTVIARTDSGMHFLDRLEKTEKLALEDFQELKNALYSHVPLNLAIKRAGDFMPIDTWEKNSTLFGEARVYTEPFYPRIIAGIRLFTTMIGQHEGIEAALKEMICGEEILDYFTSKKVPEKSSLKKRLKGTVLYYHKGKQHIFTGTEFETIKQSLNAPREDGTIRGKTAFPGHAEGVVRIVFDPTHVTEFSEGDILVTGMTRPEFLPLMKKAAAIITDAGGVLSHAAITAREIKKPTIIGTNNATKILKDGDRISIDAEKGIVKKINT